jgi:hypothetical protein
VEALIQKYLKKSIKGLPTAQRVAACALKLQLRRTAEQGRPALKQSWFLQCHPDNYIVMRKLLIF